MRAAIYIRVSTEEQAKEGYSISAQKKRLQAFCASQDWDVAGLYPDEGKSAKDTNRPELQKMLKDIKAGKIDCVLVYRLDRLTRSVFDLYKLLEVFDAHGCKFKSATEVYDTTTAMGRMFITIVAALAQWERENTGERISFGQKEKARQGKWVQNRAPFGYQLDKKHYKLHIVEEEAATVRMIYSLYQSGYGANSLSKRLNNEGRLTRKGNTWSDNTLMKILRSRVYYGAIDWGGVLTEGAHDGIISKEEFEAVQKLIKRRSDTPPRTVFSDYIFSGKIRCDICGGSVVGGFTTADRKGGERRYYYYRCRNRTRGTCKGSVNYPAHRVEEGFLKFIREYAFTDEAVQEVGEESTGEKKTDDPTKALTNELEKLTRRKKKFQFAWSDDAMEYEDFKARMEEIRIREAAINEELAKLEPAAEKEIDKKTIKRIFQNFAENWNTLDDREKKELVDSIITRIYPKKIGRGKNCRVEIERVDFV